MDVVDAMACVDTVKDDDGNDTYRPTEEAAITINSVTITTYSSAEAQRPGHGGLIQDSISDPPPQSVGRYAKVCGGGLLLCYLQRRGATPDALSAETEAVTEGD